MRTCGSCTFCQYRTVFGVEESELSCSVFFFNDTATTEIYTLSLHDALPISGSVRGAPRVGAPDRPGRAAAGSPRSEEHTSELQSPCNLVCRLLLEKKKENVIQKHILIVNVVTSLTV